MVGKAMEYRLVVSRGGAVVESRTVRERRLVIGRGGECDVQLDSVRISRKHLLLEVRDGTLVARDVGSRNGTYLDGRPISEEALRADAVLDLGGVFEARIVFQPDAAEGVSGAPPGLGGAPQQGPPHEAGDRLARTAPAASSPRKQESAPADGDGAKIACPHCWFEFDEAEVLAVAQHMDLLGDTVLGPDAPRRFLPSRFTSEGVPLDAHGLPCPALACPRCHLSIPRDLLDTPPVFLSMIGAPGSGKSYLLATMAWELRSLLPRRFAFNFSDADSVSNAMVNEYERTLFLCPDDSAWVALEKTEMHGRMYDDVLIDGMRVALPRPFMFSVVPQRHHPWGKRRGALRRTLVLYDNAGEHFEPGADTAANPGTQHLVRSSGVFFLFDPTKDSRFRVRCRGEDPQLRPGVRVERQEILLKEAFDRIRLHSGARAGLKSRRPLIVVATKFDIWRDLLGVPLESPWREREDLPAALLDGDALMAASLAVRTLLNELCPELVATAEAVASRVIYLPVSALGHSPRKDPEGTGSDLLLVRPKDIRPIWAAVPALCMMSLLGMMPSPRVQKRGDLPVAENCRLFGDKMLFTVPGADVRLEAPSIYWGHAMTCPKTGTQFWIPKRDEVAGGGRTA